MPRDHNNLKICLIAGEASGDILGANLMAALLRKKPEINFIGVGGSRMEEQGLRSIFPMNDLSVMGIVEVLPRLPKILRRISQTADLIKAEKPDIVITIDSPDFCHRVTKKVQESVTDKPVMVHYVAPTVWAWRPERAKKVAALYDGIMCLLPFEPPYFEQEGMNAAFVGHSMLENMAEKSGGFDVRGELKIAEQNKVIGCLFGSRMGELNRIGPTLRKALEKIAAAQPDIHVLAPTLPHLAPQVTNLLQGLPCKWSVVGDTKTKWACFAAMDGAIATSGTVGLELSVAGVPHVIAYKMNTMTWAMIRKKVTTKYAHLSNIIMQDLIVPEFIQFDCTPDKIAQGYLSIETGKQKEAFDKIRIMLKGSTNDAPSKQAADFVMEQLYLRSSMGTKGRAVEPV